MARNIIELQNIGKTYVEGKITFPVLFDVNLKIKKGEFISIVGPSGSGKSTLMNIIGLLDTPDSGELIMADNIITQKTKINKLAHLRRKEIGFIFQTFNLIPRISALGNVILPMIYAKRKNRQVEAKKILTAVGLEHRITHKPSELSGGERQRVAIARALANNPSIILADEPTGNLDSASGKQIINILQRLNNDGKTIILVTHDKDIAKQADRTISLKDGRVV